MESGDTNSSEASSSEKPSASKLTPWILVLAAGAGGAAPFLLPQLPQFSGNLMGAAPSAQALSDADRPTYVPFGEVIVNLDEGRMNRYLRLKMSLQISEADRIDVESAVQAQSLVLKNWLLSHLSDKNLDDIRGKVGQNQLRREIRNQFNTSLFPNSRDRINDILFEEFNVQ